MALLAVSAVFHQNGAGVISVHTCTPGTLISWRRGGGLALAGRSAKCITFLEITPCWDAIPEEKGEQKGVHSLSKSNWEEKKYSKRKETQ